MGERLKLNSVSGNVVSFDTDLERNLGSLKIGIEPVQSGSGDPSPDNVRPISEWTGARVTRAGKNLFDQSLMLDQAAWNIIKFYAPVGTVLTVSQNMGTDNGLLLYLRQAGDTTLSSKSRVYAGHPVTYAVNGQGYIEIVQRRANGEDSFANYQYQIEVGSAATDWELYAGAEYEIDWADAAGTVYGGTLDVTTGVLTVDRYGVTCDNATRISYGVSSDINRAFLVLPYTANGLGLASKTLCTMYPAVTTVGTDKTLRMYTSEADIFDSDMDITSLETVKTYLHDLLIVYPLAKPQTYQLTPTEVLTLLGANTLYADCGPIQEASYFSRDYVPVASDTGLITITDGVEAPIDSLKIHFEPIQEGNGDPSPENIRPISGWTGLDLAIYTDNTNYIKEQSNVNINNYKGLRIIVENNGKHFKITGTPTSALSFNLCTITQTAPNNLYIYGFPKLTGENRFALYHHTLEAYYDSTNINGINIDNNTNIGVILSKDKYINLDFYPIAIEQQQPVITFPSEAGTVYGGYVDVAKGVLTVNKQSIKKKLSEGTKSTGEVLDSYLYNTPFPYGSTPVSSSAEKICNLCTYSYAGASLGVPHFYCSGTVLVIYVPAGTDENTEIEVCAPIAEPLVYSLTPTQLSTIKGLNNIYSNANGAIEMSYYSPIKENMIATRRNVIASAPHIETVSGGIASFDTNMTAKLKNLTVNIEPVQDLHGYDNPWPAGGGKNNVDNSTNVVGGYYNGSGSWNLDRTIATTALVPVKANTTYTSSVFNKSNKTRVGGVVATLWDDATTATGQITTPTFTTGASTQYVRIRNFNSQGSYITDDNYLFQLEEGSTATAYEPYSNICPISGWTVANVTRNGINQWDEEWEVGTIDFNTGEIANTNNRIRTKNFNPCSPNTTYYGIDPTSNNNIEIFFYDKNKVFIRNSGWTGNATFISPNNACYFKFIMGAAYGTTYNNDISINYPSTDVNYHSYVGTTYPITFPTEAGTVYSGTLNVTTGELTVDTARIDMGDLNWSKSNSGAGRFYGRQAQTLFNYKWSNNTFMASSTYICGGPSVSGVYYGSNGTIRYWYRASESSDIREIYVCDEGKDGMTADEFKASMADQSLIYELAIPETYQLTPTEVQTLLGANNIYADTGNTNLTYWKH